MVKRYFQCYYWRLRYWALDTKHGKHVVISLVTSACALFGYLTALSLPIEGEPKQAIAWWAALLIGVAAAFLAYLIMPKPKQPTPEDPAAPEVEDGAAVLHIGGTAWVQAQLLAWRHAGTKAIKTKGGKK